jgi:hypothetical protein
MRTRLLLAGALALSGCHGTTPPINGSPERGISAVLIGGKITLPTGPTRNGKMWIDLEGEEERGRDTIPEIYRLIVRPQQALMYQVEPGLYHFAPARTMIGTSSPYVSVKIEGRTYRVPFPKDILRRAAIDVKPAKIVSLGILEASLEKALPGRKPVLRVKLNDSVQARRDLVQDMIHNMMDPNTPSPVRESAVDWTRALDQTLGELTAESVRPAPFRKGP